MSYVTKENTEDIYPLSPTQKGMLFHSIANNNSPIYFEQLSFTINGPLNLETFIASWNHMIAITPVFRTVFKWTKVKEPLQIALKNLPVKFDIHDILNLDEKKQQDAIQEFFQKDRQKPFELEEGPVMRFAIFIMDKNKHHFLWSHHHILIDGWCLPIIMKDIFEIYISKISGGLLPAPVRRPYRDYISWYLKQDENKAKSFWKDQLGDFYIPTKLPLDRVPAQSSSFNIKEEQLVISRDQTSLLKKLAAKTRVTQSTITQTVWAILLAHYSNHEDVVFGSVVSGRPADLKGSEDMIGLFINTLPVRVKLSKDMTLLELLQNVQETSLAIRDYEYSLLPDVKACSGVEKDILFNSIVVFENYPVGSMSIGNEKSFGISDFKSFEMTNFPLTIIVSPGECLTIKMLYFSEFYNDETIQRVLAHMAKVINSIIENSDIALSQLNILGAEENDIIFNSFNNTDAPFPREKCPYMLFEEQVEKTPDNIALSFDENILTYNELNERVNQLAHYLRSLGVEKDSKVGLMVERSFDMIIGLLGIQKAGGAYVPMDPEYPGARILYMLEDSESPVLVSQSHLLERLTKYPDKVVLLDSDSEKISKESSDNPVAIAASENLSHLIYTSGSTGLPKGVMIEHRNVTAFLSWALTEFSYEEYKEMIASTSMCFDLSVFEFFLPLITGAKVIILRSSLELNDYLEKNTATMINTVPSALRFMLSGMKKRHNVKAINLAGEPLKLDLVNDIYSEVDVDIVRNLYGPTEDTTYSTNFRVPKNFERQPLIGKPISNTKVYILSKLLTPAPIGVMGEIYLSGSDIARGYWKAPEKTAERFIPNPFAQNKNQMLYKTGDLGSWMPDGNIKFYGRVDYQVKIRGNRIEPGEIDARLAEHEKISDVVVIDKDTKEGDKYLVAYYVSKKELSAADLREFIKKELPEYMVPSRFVLLSELPLTSNGKVDRKCLPDVEAARPEVSCEFVAPGNDIEKKLAEIWRKALNIDKVGVYDNFFDLGGHSLLIMKVLAQLKFIYPLAVQDFFDCQTIARLAKLALDRMSGSGNASQVSLTEEETRSDINVNIIVSGQKEQFRAVLLTGVTGYLGAHLLYELLNNTDSHIYCLIRGESEEHIDSRLKSTLEFYFGNDKIDFSRITPMRGDIGIDGFGLNRKSADEISGNIDAIAHSAADVRHFGEYSHFNNINVAGTERLLDLAKSCNCKRFYYISTLSISGDYIPGMKKAVFKETDHDRNQILNNVYARSKFEAEAIVMKAMNEGLNATIFRVGNLVGESTSGKFQRTIDTSSFYGLIKGIAHMGATVEGADGVFDMTPINSCREAIVKMMLVPETSGITMHIYNSNLVNINFLVDQLKNYGYNIKTLSGIEYANVLRGLTDGENGGEAFEKLMPYLTGSSSQKSMIIYDNSYAEYFLGSINFEWPKMNKDIIFKLIDYCVNVGFLLAPGKSSDEVQV